MKIRTFLVTLFLVLLAMSKINAQSGLWGTCFMGGSNSYGTIYSTDSNGNYFILRHSFVNKSFGMNPSGAIIRASNKKFYGMTRWGGLYNLGVIYEYDANLNTLTDIIDFNDTNGSNPDWNSLIQANNGKLYGLIPTGGGLNNNYGVLFEYDINTKTITKINYFNGSLGYFPQGSLLQASNGKLYGLASAGGSSGYYGTLFEYDINTSSLTKKVDFNGTSNGSAPYGSLIQANNGKLYGTTIWGGGNDSGTLFEYDINTNALNTLFAFGGSTNGANPYSSLVQANNGKLYGMTYAGGVDNKGVLFEYDINLNILTKKYDFIGTLNGYQPQRYLVQSSNGKLFGTVDLGGIPGAAGVLLEYDFNTNTFTKKIDFQSSEGIYPGNLMFLPIDTTFYSSFSVNDTSQCLKGNNFIFTNKSVIGSGSYTNLWKFGDGTTSTALNPIHTYSTVGTFIVQLITTTVQGKKDSFFLKVYTRFSPVSSFTINDTAQCQSGNNFIFTNKSIGSSTNHWLFGDSITSDSVNPSHFYLIGNIYNVKLIVTSLSGCSDSISKSVIVYPMPKADYTIWDSAQCLPKNNFGFVNTSMISSGNMTYLWKFGDGDTSSLINPIHHYNYSDTFLVTLVATSDFGCMDSTKKHTYVIVHPKPKADFSIVDSAQCLTGNNFIDSNTSSILSGKITQIWYFGDGDTTSSLNASHTYKTADTFYTKLLVISDWFCKDSILKPVIVYPMPKTNFTVNDSIQCLVGNNFILRDTTFISSGTITGFLWNLGDGTKGNTNYINHSYANTDTFIVQLRTTSIFGCSDSTTKKIYVLPKPIANFAINDSSQCLKGNLFNFYDSTKSIPGIHKNLWKFGDGNTSDSINSKYTYGISGKFPVTLLYSFYGCTDSITKNVYILQSPKVDFSINQDTLVVCGNYFIFSNKSSVSPPDTLTYQWNFGDGDTSDTISPNHKYMKTGTFPVMLVAKSLEGCLDTVIKKVLLLPCSITVDFSFPNGCVGDTILFTNNSTISGDSFSNFLWNFGDNTSTQMKTNPRHIYYKPGTFTVSLIGITYSGIKDSTHKNINIYPNPILSLTFSGDTTFYVGNSVTINVNGIYDSILWSNGKKGTSVTFTQTGNYKLIVIDSNGCRDSTIIHILVEAIPQLIIMDVITPNGDGYNDYWKILNADAYGKLKVRIFNRWDDELYSSPDYKNDWNGKYNGKDLPEGTYYYLIETEKGDVYKGAINILR